MRSYLYKLPVFLASFLFLLHCSGENKGLSDKQKLTDFFAKKEVTILVTDSGLGGISVAADVVERMKDTGLFEKVNVIFFNAQPHIKSGYNMQKTNRRKIHIFENALESAEKKFNPDMILLACNTLSVLYPFTEYSKQARIPVIGVVEAGVKLIRDRMENDNGAQVILFATKTTVNQGTHKKMLIATGIPGENIITQACPGLASTIERGSHSQETIDLVSAYVDSVLGKIDPATAPLYVSFNCTHYGYVADIFADVFQKRSIAVRDYLDPNPRMADFLFQKQYFRRYKQTDLTVEMISQPELPPERIASIAALIEKQSPLTAEALRNYAFEPNLFEWKSIAAQKTEALD